MADNNNITPLNRIITRLMSPPESYMLEIELLSIRMCLATSLVLFPSLLFIFDVWNHGNRRDGKWLN